MDVSQENIWRKLSPLSYENRLRLTLIGCMLPVIFAVVAGVWVLTSSRSIAAAAALCALLLSAYAVREILGQITRPLQTLTNVVAALRERDFSFRAHGANRGDSFGDLAFEINALASTLQSQRTATRDALTLAERVMEAMRTPVLAFNAAGHLRLLNPAAASAFHLDQNDALSCSAEALGLASLFQSHDGGVFAQLAVSGVAGENRWSLRRSTFRLGGVPHELFVLSDVQQALREEERLAWQRLIRVLSHEINNSLTPITSIASALRTRTLSSASSTTVSTEALQQDLHRGLRLIEDRALSLRRFLQAYQQLTRLPPPSLQRVELAALVRRVVSFESRVAVEVVSGPALAVEADPAQIDQLLINLLRNAADAALSVAPQGHTPTVSLRWFTTATDVIVCVEDSGPGLADTANLFVPFYTTKANGTGVGLALAKQIAAAHNGTLHLANRNGAAGCMATLRLPLP